MPLPAAAFEDGVHRYHQFSDEFGAILTVFRREDVIDLLTAAVHAAATRADFLFRMRVAALCALMLSA